MEIEDLDLDDTFFAAPAGPPQRARRSPVRVGSQNAQCQQPSSVGTPATSKPGLFALSRTSDEARPFTPVSDQGDRDPWPVVQSEQRTKDVLQQPKPAAAKPVDRATALLQQLEAKAEQQKAGAWGRPSRPAAAAGTSSGGRARVEGGVQQPTSYNAQGAAPPVLNDSKVELARRRWLQTSLGGPKLVIPAGCAPPGFLAVQMLLWLLPVIVGVPLSLFKMASTWLAPVIAAGIMLALHLSIQALRMSRGSRVAPADAPSKSSMLKDEDEIDFALFSGQGLAFLVPALGWAAVPYGMCSAALVGVATAYLSPALVSSSLGGGAVEGGAISGATAGYLACCWLCVALAGYSLNAHPPPEPNRYSSSDSGGVLGPTSRAVHLLLIMVPAVADAQWDVLLTRGLCASLPLLWAAGTLPPTDCLLEWAMEQAHVHLLGGSTGASALRLTVMFAASCLVVTITILLYQAVGMQGALAAACPLGLLLSHDLAPSPQEAAHRPKSAAEQAAAAAPVAALRRCGGSAVEAAWRGVLLVVLAVLPLVLPRVPGGVSPCSGGSCILFRVLVLVLCVVCAGSSILQRPYLLFLVANPVVRGAPALSADGKLQPARNVLRMVHVAASRLGSLVLVIYVVVVSSVPSMSAVSLASGGASGSLLLAWKLLCIVRAVRKAWQSPAGALTEAAVATWVGETIVSEGCSLGLSATGWCALGPCEQWLIVGRVLGIAADVVCKLHFLVTLAVTSWTDARQRARLASTYLALLVVGAPFVLVIVVAAATLSAPLLPVLGVPLFVIGFPRPKRHWPSIQGSQAASLDAAYYKHLMPSAIRGLVAAIFGGEVGSDVRGGEIFLLRRDSLLVMVQVLERGCGWVQLLCKGLELQETSCHHVEAGTVEEIMDSGLGDCTLSSAAPALPWWNPWTMNTLEPLTKIPATVYSLADTQLTGVIDRPENATDVPRLFSRALMWLLRQREAAQGLAPAAWFDVAALEEIEGRPLDYSAGARLWDSEWAKAIGLWPAAPVALERYQPPAATSLGAGAVKPSHHPLQAQKSAPAPSETAGNSAGAPHSSNNNTQSTPSATRAVAVLPTTPPRAQATKTNAKVEDDVDIDDLDDLLNEFTVGGGNFGSEVDADALIDELDESLGLSPSHRADHSPTLSSSPTRAHAELNVDEGSGGARSGVDRGRDRSSGGGGDRLGHLRAWLGACWGVVEDWGHLTSKAGAEHTAMVFAGELPRSEHAKWLRDASRGELKELVLKAFRYAVKFSYDCSVYGTEETQDELVASFREYDAQWYFGPENSPGWAAAVETGVPNLMSIWKEKGASRGRVASLVDGHMQVGRLNAEAARGLWASLGMELYYFTNDDDERYSIQSNTALLRNLMVQTAAPPLGYALYVCNASS